MLLDGLQLFLSFGKLRFINDRFITEKNLGTKKPRKVFLAKIVLTSSICMQSLVEIDKRTATGERKIKSFLFGCHANGSRRRSASNGVC